MAGFDEEFVDVFVRRSRPFLKGHRTKEGGDQSIKFGLDRSAV
jgi:hypothetical protein